MNAVKGLTDLVAAAEAAVLVMPQHVDCEGKVVCEATHEDARCCAGEVTELQRTITEARRSL